MLASKERNYHSLDEYFDYIAETTGYPRIYKEFSNDFIYSDELKIHMDLLVHDKPAPTVVFIPGTALYAMCYAEFLYKLHQRGYNVIGFDPRGHGRSEGTRGDYSVEELMRDAQNVVSYAIHRFGDNVSLMGSSQGGIVAFYIAAKDSRIKGVTCQNFADLTSEASNKLTRFPRLSKYLKPLMIRLGGLAADTPVPVNIYLDLDSIEVKYFGTAKKFMNMDPLALHTVSFRALQSLASTPLPCAIEDINIPVMVFQGDADSIFSLDFTKEIYDKLTCKKRFSVFPGATHAIMIDEADTIVGPIAKWLEEIHEPVMVEQ